MIKMTICAGRCAGFTHQQFRDYVTRVHGPLVASVAEVAADLHAYHYNFPVAVPRPLPFGHPLADTLDIVTQGWFDSVEAQRANMRHPRYLEVLRPDEGRFADEARAVMHYMAEHPVSRAQTPARPAPYKVLVLRRRRDGLAREPCQQAWLGHAGPLLAGALPAGCSYVQNHAVAESEHPVGADPKYYDLIDEFGLARLEDALRVAPTGEAGAALQALESEWLDTARTRVLVTETVVSLPWRGAA